MRNLKKMPRKNYKLFALVVGVIIIVGSLLTFKNLQAAFKSYLLVIHNNTVESPDKISKEYMSVSGKFSFLYPNMYPIVSKTGEDLVRQYGWRTYYPGFEWIEFREKFIPTSSLSDQSDNLADIIIQKATDSINIQQYKQNIMQEYQLMSAVIPNHAPLQMTNVQVAGQKALHVALKQTTTSYNIPNDGYIFSYGGDLYILDFHNKAITDQIAIKQYEFAKNIILSTFNIKTNTYSALKDSSLMPTPALDNEIALVKTLPKILPNGWFKATDTNFRKTLSGITYTVDFQLNNEEYLKEGGAYTRQLQLLDTLITKKGTKLYLVKESEEKYIYVSACMPTKLSACSVPFGEQLLFIMLHVYRPNDQYPRELDFNASDIGTITQELKQIIQSTNF